MRNIIMIRICVKEMHCIKNKLSKKNKMICVLYIFEEKRVKFDRKEAILLLLRLKCVQDVSSMSHNKLKII